jgi:hypothetical protein
MPCQWYVRGGGEGKRWILIGHSVFPTPIRMAFGRLKLSPLVSKKGLNLKCPLGPERPGTLAYLDLCRARFSCRSRLVSTIIIYSELARENIFLKNCLRQGEKNTHNAKGQSWTTWLYVVCCFSFVQTADCVCNIVNSCRRGMHLFLWYMTVFVTYSEQLIDWILVA